MNRVIITTPGGAILAVMDVEGEVIVKERDGVVVEVEKTGFQRGNPRTAPAPREGRSRVHPHRHHHVTNLDDCRQILEQIGFHFDEKASYESTREIVAVSTEISSPSRPTGTVSLNKRLGTLTVTDRFPSWKSQE